MYGPTIGTCIWKQMDGEEEEEEGADRGQEGKGEDDEDGTK